MTLLERLAKRSPSFLLTLGFLFIAAQSVVHYLADPDVFFDFFYLLPVSLIAWLLGRRAGIAISVASAVSYFLSDVSTEHYYPHPYIPFFNVAARMAAFLLVSYFVSELRRSLNHERELARTDDLTGVLNRRSFFEAANQEINRARRHRHPFTVAYMDVDDFKVVNDRYGHSVGDTVLRAVTQTIKDNIREIDLIARLGGDEFVILLPETGDEAAEAVVARVHRSITNLTRQNEWPVSFSVGVVTWLTPPRTVDLMLKQADDTMYAIKNGGKNRVAHLKVSGEPIPAA